MTRTGRPRRGTFDPTTYARWRAKLPWTDQQIGAAMLDLAGFWFREGYETRGEYFLHRAEQIAAGHVSGRDLKQVLTRLITTCEECGASATYRVGVSGYCRAHKPLARLRQQADQLDREARERTLAYDQEDRARRQAEKHHRTMGRRRNNPGLYA